MKKLSIGLLCLGLATAFAPLGFAQVKSNTVNSHAFIWDSTHGMRDLGTLGGSNSYATGINGSGTVVGYSDISGDATTHAFLWTAKGGMVDIGQSSPGKTGSQAAAINASGGVAASLFAHTRQQAAAYASGHWFAYGLTEGEQLNYSFGINNANELTGQVYDNFILYAFLWQPATGTKSYLPTLPGGTYTVGNAINNLTHITGTGNVTDGNYEAFIWSADNGIQDIGSFESSNYTAGTAINDNDQIVGLNDDFSGFYWSEGTGMVALQSLNGGTVTNPAFGINQSGVIAGYSVRSDGSVHAVIWSDYASAPQDLGTLHGGVNSYARGLNNKGQVVGYADAN
jgi:probable HAF family extracellular repeat protein